MHESRLANLLGAAVLTLSDRMTAAAASAAGVSLSGTAALVVLAEFPGLGGTDLAHRIGIGQPAAARMLDQLEARGLVERQGKQGRGVAVVLTEAGRAAARRALTARQEVLVRALRSVADRDALEPVLEELLRGLHAEVRSGDLMCRLCDRPGCVAQRKICPVGAAERRS